MKNYTLTLINVTACIILSMSTLRAEQTMTWPILDWPPMHITEGDYKDGGLFDAILKHFKQELPDYTHQELVSNPLRFWEYIKNGENYCHVASIVTAARLEHAYFSMPNAILLSNTVIMDRETAKKMGLTDSVSLKELMEHPELTGGIKANRSYGNAIDSVLKKHRRQNNIYEQKSGNFGFSLFEMLLMGRVDYILEYSYVASYFEKKLNKEGHAKSLLIEEANPYQFAYVACPRNEWGKEMIKRINGIIKKARPTYEYRKIMEMWQDDEGIKRVQKGYDELFMHTREVNESEYKKNK